MALVRSFEEITPTKANVHGEVECTYSHFVGNDGQHYLQLNTYGSAQRQNRGKQSQTIQLDKDSARKLAALLRRYFGE